MRGLKHVVAAAIGAYFLYFAAGGVQARFASDDMMNLGGYFRRGLWATLGDNLAFWSTAYRPFGGLFYLPLYYSFGLDPLPYRLVALTLIGLNIALAYRVARLVSGSHIAGALAAVGMTAHPGMADLYYHTSHIYDVLACTGVLSILAVYLGIRSRGRAPGRAGAAVLSVLFICALNAKEIAVVAPGFLLAYEFLLQPSGSRHWRASLLLIAIALVYSAGKLWGPNPITSTAGYRLELSPAQYVATNTVYVNGILGAKLVDSAGSLVLVWLALALLCCWSAKLRWCWWLIVTAVLPLSFIPPRSGGSLYVPLLGWVLLAAFLPRELVSRRRWQTGIAAALALGIAASTIVRWQGQAFGLLAGQQLTWDAIQQVRSLNLHPRPHSSVLFLNDPFAEWDLLFIAQLVWHEPSIEIRLVKPGQAVPAEEAQFDYVLAFEGGSLHVKRPERKS